jgi:hypothetical protein
MLTKEKFIRALTELKSLEEDIDNVHVALQKLDPDFGGFYLSRVSTLIVNLLKDAMNDKYDYIDYFIYELEYGKKWKKGMITDKNKKDIKLQTAEDLYNYIIKIV